MRFAHLADCHIGGWRDQKMKDANLLAFSRAIGMCLHEQVDFVLICGDLFNTALPAIEGLKEVVMRLRELGEAGIPVYVVAGSHDYSPSGKTMLDVLEHAGLLVNVLRGGVINGKLHLHFTVDPKTGTKLAGMLGKRGLLEKSYYEGLDLESLEAEQGFKIFLFHTTIAELKPAGLEALDSVPLSLLPKGFDYYAGGHVHAVIVKREPEHGLLAYPGALFPNNFKELEELHNGGFYIVNADSTGVKPEWIPIVVNNVLSISLDCGGMTPARIEEMISARIKPLELNNTIVTLRLSGCLKGKVSNINLKGIYAEMYAKSAYFLMPNTRGLVTEEFDDIKVKSESVEQVEQQLIREKARDAKSNIPILNDEQFVHKLLQALNKERDELERQNDFEERIKAESIKLLDVK